MPGSIMICCHEQKLKVTKEFTKITWKTKKFGPYFKETLIHSYFFLNNRVHEFGKDADVFIIYTHCCDTLSITLNETPRHGSHD
jgi:hypothetical protein